MKFICKKNLQGQRPLLVKIITILGYDVFTLDTQFLTPFYKHRGNSIWIKVNSSGDYVVAEYEEKKPFYDEISDYIRDILPDVGGYLFRSNGNIEDLFKTNDTEPIFYNAIDRNNRILASFYISRNDIEKVGGYGVRLDFCDVKAYEADALVNLYDYMERQMQDHWLLQDCCFCYKLDGEKNYSNELDFHPDSCENGIYYKYWD